MMACISNVSELPFKLIFIEHIDVSTRPTKCADDGSIFGMSILRVLRWCKIHALM